MNLKTLRDTSVEWRWRLSCQNDQSEETRQVQYFGTTTEKILSCMHTYLRQSQWIGASDQFQSVSRIVEEQKLLVFIFIKQPLLSCNIKGGKNENQLAFVRVVIKWVLCFWDVIFMFPNVRHLSFKPLLPHNHVKSVSEKALYCGSAWWGDEVWLLRCWVGKLVDQISLQPNTHRQPNPNVCWNRSVLNAQVWRWRRCNLE